jgi:hypothetical protein
LEGVVYDEATRSRGRRQLSTAVGGRGWLLSQSCWLGLITPLTSGLMPRMRGSPAAISAPL